MEIRSLISTQEILQKCDRGSIEPYRGTNMLYNILYKTTCLIDGKVYIGVHSTDDLNDNYIGYGIYGNCSYTIEKARAKTRRESIGEHVSRYGVENFVRENILFFDDMDTALSQERLVVDREWARDSRTLNVKIGGVKPPKRKGEQNGNYNRKWSLEKRKEFSEKLKRERITIGDKNSNAKKSCFYNLSSGKFEYYNTRLAFCEKYGIKYNTMDAAKRYNRLLQRNFIYVPIDVIDKEQYVIRFCKSHGINR